MKRQRLNDAAAQFIDMEARAADSDEEDEDDEIVHGASIDIISTYNVSIEFR